MAFPPPPFMGYREHIEAARQRALNWTPDADHVDPARMTWQSVAACIIGFFTDAMHAAECEGCAVKAGQQFDPLDGLPFHNVFEVDHNPGAQMLQALKAEHAQAVEWWRSEVIRYQKNIELGDAQISEQNELLTLLQSQRDAYKTRLDSLMADGMIVDKSQYRVVFEDETETEVRVRLEAL